MIERTALLSDLQALLKRLEADLLERSGSAEVPDVGKTLRAEYERAQKAERTAQNYEDWRTDAVTQVAAAWVLSCVFTRFLEDNGLIDPPKISGPKERLQQARDEHEIYFHKYLKQTDRNYLLSVFNELANLPGTADIFGDHNPIRELPNWLSGDAAGELLQFFQKIDANTGTLIHDFTDPNWDTRFLGDLYQDLSEAARKKYALLQTPEFVEEFILDRTLEPALDEFGLQPSIAPAAQKSLPGLDSNGDGQLRSQFRMIDPACGSGHFLLGAFRRILARWQRQEPGANPRVLVQRTLDSIHGVDVNPYAIAIARCRLLLAALAACGVKRLAESPAFILNLVCGDSLLHGGANEQMTLGYHDLDHVYQPEDIQELRRILRSGHYHAVVANPPYITPKDRALNQAYRERYSACHMKYSLSVPFMERIFRLALPGESGALASGAGYTGQITANSFMKREFGKKLIESLLPTIDLTHVIDTSGAYIPGHGTPTVILFGRRRKPVASTIRTVMGIRGEPSTPDDPSHGLVWSSIVSQIDIAGSQSEFVSVGDSSRDLFAKHPWSIGGGGAAELKEQLEEGAAAKADSLVDSIGFASFTGQDEAFVSSFDTLMRARIPRELIKAFVVGDGVRDWQITAEEFAFAPYDFSFESIDLCLDCAWARWLWPMRAAIGSVISFGGRTRLECGDNWWTWYRWIPEKYRTPLSIVFGEVATHNHFVLDRGGKVFKQTAPVIKLPADASEDDHLALLGLLNSSTACFWMKQVCFPKGTATGDISKEKGKAEANRFAFNSTAIGEFPLPNWSDAIRRKIVELSRSITSRADSVDALCSRNRLNAIVADATFRRLRQVFEDDVVQISRLKGEMVFLQEELDWVVYRAYGLADGPSHEALENDVPAVGATDRPFNSPSPPTSLLSPVRDLWKSRQAMINQRDAIRLIETPVYKRPWSGRQGVYGLGSRTTEEKQRDVQRLWLLDRLESYFDFDGRMNDKNVPTAKFDISLISIAALTDVARRDEQFQEVGKLYRNDPAFDVQALVAELVGAESVPLLPVLRYKETGLRKRTEWEQTWDLQRREDAGEKVGPTVPPKYDSKDFLTSNFWRLRGKLDVPKERWISFPHCEGPDGTPVIAWAGYDHLQLARAISAYFVDIQERLGGRDDPRLVPLLACVIEILPWLKQWHHEIDPDYNQRMDEVFEGFVTEEAKNLGMTLDEIKAWQPPKRTAGRGRRRTGT